MASLSSFKIFFIATLLFTFGTLPSHAALISVNRIQILGLVVCSATGNLTPTRTNCRGLAGANVTITCNGPTTSVANVITDPSGFFNALLTIADGLLLDTSSVPCTVNVNLPIANCTLLAGSGALRAPVTLLGTITSGVLGLVAQVTAGAFQLVPM